MTAVAIDNVAAFGVEEISTESAEQIGGGFWPALLVGAAGSIVAHIAIEIYNDVDAAVSAFKEGFNSVP